MTEMLHDGLNNEKFVVIERTSTAEYPQAPPFSPHENYPENHFGEVGTHRNVVYEAVRSCFRASGLDSDNYGRPEWNPLRGLILPGQTVLLKPNLVKELHPRDPDGWQYVLTHGSVIRAVADYVWKALQGKGKIVVADAPQTDSSFAEIVRKLGLDQIESFYRSHGLDFSLVDLRKEEWISKDDVILSRRAIPGDPAGCIPFDLGEASEFAGHAGAGNYYGADYDAGVVNYHHSEGRHEYLIAGSAIDCDVIFSLPKLKTHKKAGITASLKNLVGINGDKNWLPHHTEGDPATGGDEHPDSHGRHKTERALVPYFNKLSLSMPGIGPWVHRHARRIGRHFFGDTDEVVRSGNWWGNDTVWRMSLDLNKIVLYGNRDGTMREAVPENRKRHLVMVDGVIAGEGRGPLNPDPVRAGILIFGMHPASVDATCAYLMGFDPDRIPIVRQSFRCRHFPLAEWNWSDVSVISTQPEWNGLLKEIPEKSTFHFKPHFGWVGHIERTYDREVSEDAAYAKSTGNQSSPQFSASTSTSEIKDHFEVGR
jgi:uncharacterized protein (DUF362 family)